MTNQLENRKFRFPLNLQLFADGDPEDDDQEFEIDEDEDDDSIEIDLEDDTDDDEEEVSEGDGHQGADDEQDGEESDGDDAKPKGKKQVNAGKGKNETAAAVIAERKKWQAKLKTMESEAAATKRFMAQVGVQDLDELNRRMDAFEANKLEKQGVPAELAQRIASAERQLKEQQQDIRRQKFAVEAERLKADPFYSDLEDHREELEALAERNGSTIKAAYLSEHGERRLKEREAEIEAKVKANKVKRDKKKVDTSTSGTSSNKSTRRVNLSQEERAIAKAAGMTPEEYAKYKR